MCVFFDTYGSKKLCYQSKKRDDLRSPETEAMAIRFIRLAVQKHERYYAIAKTVGNV